MFLVDWFTPHIPDWEKWLAKYKNMPGIHFLEIGCFEGRATKWLLENILNSDTAFITVIDPFTGSMEHLTEERKEELQLKSLYNRFLENVEPYRWKVNLYVGKSQMIMRGADFITLLFDFIYIDGSHLACDVLEDCILSFRQLRRGGIMVMDDYKWDRYPDNPLLCPKLGIDTFLQVFAGQYKILHQSNQVAIEKI